MCNKHLYTLCSVYIGTSIDISQILRFLLFYDTRCLHIIFFADDVIVLDLTRGAFEKYVGWHHNWSALTKCY